MSRNLFVVGPQRTGTTWIYEQLCAQSSGVYVDRVIKESNVFLGDHGPERHRREVLANATGRGTLDVLADVCSVYAGVPDTLQRIDAAFPDARFVWIRRENGAREESLRTHHHVNHFGRHAIGFALSEELLELQSDLDSWASSAKQNFPGRTLELDFSELKDNPQGWVEKLSQLIEYQLDFMPLDAVNASRGGASLRRRLVFGAARHVQRTDVYEWAKRATFARAQPELRSALAIASRKGATSR